MSDLYGLKLEPMPNRLVNYGTTDNGIAVIELASDSAGAPLEGDAMGPNTYTHEMMRDIDTAIIKARFDDDVTVIVITGNGSKFFSAGDRPSPPPARASREEMHSPAQSARADVRSCA